MNKKLIVRIAEGLGNQLFMYAHAYALSKKLNYKLYIDDTSGYYQSKNRLRGQKYMLNKFEIENEIADQNDKFDNLSGYLRRKFLKSFDQFRKKKRFMHDTNRKINNKKTSFFEKFDCKSFSEKLYVEGHYECEKYFIDYRGDIIKKLCVKKNFIKNSEYKDLLNNSNSVSIHIRRHKYSEQVHEKKEIKRRDKSEKFTKDTISYIKNSINYLEKKLNNPKFFIWTNDFTGIENDFDPDKFTYVKNNDPINDFHLFSFAKHFIVGTSSYHWWGAWINTNQNKICIKPPVKINPSDNIEFYPTKWIDVS